MKLEKMREERVRKEREAEERKKEEERCSRTSFVRSPRFSFTLTVNGYQHKELVNIMIINKKCRCERVV